MAYTPKLREQIYQGGVIIAGLAVAAYLSFAYSVSLPWQTLLAFIVLSVLAELLPVPLPNGGFVSVGFAITISVFIIGGYLDAVLVSVLGVALANMRRFPRTPLVYLFNLCQLTITIAVAGMIALNNLGPLWYGIAPVSLVSGFIIYYLLNTFFIATAITLNEGISLTKIWVVNFRWGVLSFLALAPLGFLMAMLYQSQGLWTVLLFFVPLLMARWSFKAYVDMRQAYDDTVQSLAAAIDAKDPYTHGHSQRVSRYAVALGRAAGLPEKRLEEMGYIALLHDVGKIGIPDPILQKPDRLSDQEMSSVKQHPVTSSEIVSRIHLLHRASSVVRAHHERWDGKGYPDGLLGEDIPLEARIIAVADAFDAMTSTRPYREALAPEAALEELKLSAGSQLDAYLVELFEGLFSELAPTGPQGPPPLARESSRDPKAKELEGGLKAYAG